MIPPPDVKELNFSDYFQIVWKRKVIVLSIIFTAVGFVSYRDFTTEKVYKAKAVVLMQPERIEVTGAGGEFFRQKGKDQRNTIEYLLKSFSLAERVAKKTGVYQHPEFIRAKNPAVELHKMVNIEPVANSDLFTIEIIGGDPALIANVANVWAEEAIKEDIDRKLRVTTDGYEWLRKQAEDTLVDLQNSERKLNNFLKENKIITIPEVGEKAENTIQSLQIEKVRLEKNIIEALKIYKEKHPNVVSLENQLEAVQKKLDEETEKMYVTQELSLQFNLLQREVNENKNKYQTFRKKMSDLDMSRELIAADIQVVDKAQPPNKPIKPLPEKDILQALIASLAFSVGLAYFLEYIDSTLKTSDEVELYTKMPFLGYLPFAAGETSDLESADLVSHKKQFSQIAEAFRNLRVSLLFVSPEDKPLKKFVITSSVPQEGKTFVSINLAMAFASAKEPTLLVDADMRRGRIAEAFKIDNINGLTSVLAGMCTLEEAIVKTNVPNLYVVPRGATAPNPAQLLSSEKLTNTLDEMEKKFKRVVLDVPPMLSVADAMVISSKSDGSVFVLRANKTPLKHAMEAKKIMEGKVKIIGAILNGVDMKKDRYYYYHYSYATPESSKKS
jgi:polysaccharide biosynthesis transport protein